MTYNHNKGITYVKEIYDEDIKLYNEKILLNE